jgi:hypothetical protein
MRDTQASPERRKYRSQLQSAADSILAAYARFCGSATVMRPSIVLVIHHVKAGRTSKEAFAGFLGEKPAMPKRSARLRMVHQTKEIIAEMAARHRAEGRHVPTPGLDSWVVGDEPLGVPALPGRRRLRPA